MDLVPFAQTAQGGQFCSKKSGMFEELLLVDATNGCIFDLGERILTSPGDFTIKSLALEMVMPKKHMIRCVLIHAKNRQCTESLLKLLLAGDKTREARVLADNYHGGFEVLSQLCSETSLLRLRSASREVGGNVSLKIRKSEAGFEGNVYLCVSADTIPTTEEKLDEEATSITKLKMRLAFAGTFPWEEIKYEERGKVQSRYPLTFQEGNSFSSKGGVLEAQEAPDLKKRKR